MTRSAGIPSSRLSVPPWAIAAVCTVIMLVLGMIGWPGISGPCKDAQLNRAIYAAAGRSFAPEKLAEITSLDLHRVRVRSFEGLETCPNIERLRIHLTSTSAWTTWAESQFSPQDVDPQTPDKRPKLPLLPKLKEVSVGAPGEE